MFKKHGRPLKSKHQSYTSCVLLVRWVLIKSNSTNSGEFTLTLIALWASAFNGEHWLASCIAIHLKTWHIQVDTCMNKTRRYLTFPLMSVVAEVTWSNTPFSLSNNCSCFYSFVLQCFVQAKGSVYKKKKRILTSLIFFSHLPTRFVIPSIHDT